MKKNIKAKTILLMLSILFILVFTGIIILSIAAIWAESESTKLLAQQKTVSRTIEWLTKFTKFDEMKDPISIFIQMLTTIGGVFFGIRIGQWIDERENKENLNVLWGKIGRFLNALHLGINTQGVSIRELAEYKIYWESLQRSDNAAARLLQADDKYTEISYVFSFLSFYNQRWNNFDSIFDWINNSSSPDKKRISEWINKLESLIVYTTDKTT